MLTNVFVADTWQSSINARKAPESLLSCEVHRWEVFWCLVPGVVS